MHSGDAGRPAGGDRLEWLLLTSQPVRERRDAERVLRRHLLRRRIDDWRRVLWAGLTVDELGHRCREPVERALTIKAVIAWRLAAMAALGRKQPELPLPTLFSDAEIAALADFAKVRGLRTPDSVDRAVLTTAVLGGYLDRNRGPAPGSQVIWESFTRLRTMGQAYEMLERLGRRSHLYSMLVESEPGE